MATGVVFEGKTLDDAVRKGLEALGLSRAEVSITVMEEGSSGFLGIGARPYRVRIMPRPGGPPPEPMDDDRRRGAGRGRDRDRGGRGARGGREDRGGRREGGRSTPQPAVAAGGRSEREPAGRGERSGGREGYGRGRDARGGRAPGDAPPRRDERGERDVRGREPLRAGPREARETAGREPRDSGGRERESSGGREVSRGGMREERDTRGREGRGADRPMFRDDRTRGHREPAPVAERPELDEFEEVSTQGEAPTMGMRPAEEGDDAPRGRRRRRGRGRRGREGEPMPMSSSDSGSAIATEISPSATVAMADDAERDAEAPRAPFRSRESSEMRESREPREPREPAIPPEQLAEEARAITEGVLRAMGFDATVTARAEEDRAEVSVSVPERDELLTGPKGEVRQAIQHLLNLMLNRGHGARYHLQLEVNDFWAKREEELQRLARDLAEDALGTGREAVTEYLNAQERRIVHMTLKEDARVKTYALGTGLIKRVAVAPADFAGGPQDDDG